MDHGRHLIGLIDAASQPRAGLVIKEAQREAEHMSKGLHNQAGFHTAGDARAAKVGAQGAVITAYGDEKQPGYRFKQGAEGLLGRAGRDGAGTVRFGSGGRRGVLHEEAGHIVDGVAVNQGLKQVGAGG